MKLKYNLFSIIVLLLGITTVVSCQNEADIAEAKGGLRIMLNSISNSTLTRATPREIGTPVADKFNIKVVDNASGMTKYDGKMTNELIRLAGGEYTVTASCGENPIIATDAPYYIGTQEVTVVQNEVTETSISCKVGNALISVIFGANESDRTRFAKFYKSYGVRVKVDGYSVDIPSTASSMSAYFRAGSTPELEFYGVLAANDQQVNMVLTTPKEGILPNPFKAADHAIVTLTLPDPESATVLDISKVELTEATMEETIPLSWLPIPQATAEHQYDANGDLVGTNVTFTNSYPGMAWKAVVTDGNGNEFRTIEGTGKLESTYSENSEGWPYLPAGNYTATYYLVKDGEPQKTGSREFTVGHPNLQLSLSGAYTSYSRYTANDIAAANNCDASTLYAPSAKLNVSAALLNNAHYQPCEYTASVSGNQFGTKQSVKSNTYTWNNVTGLTPRSDAYVFTATASFMSETATASTDGLYITGLPASYAPPKGDQGWKFTAGGNCSFESNYMKLATTVAPTPKAQSPSYYCPNDVNVVVTTSANQNTGIFNYKYTLHFVGSGSNVENTTSKGNAKTYVNNGTLKAGEDHLITEYSYIAAGNYLQIYSLNVQYR